MARTSKRYLDKAEDTEKSALLIEEYSVGIYSRLSVDHDDKKSESIENQIEIIRQYIADKNREPDRKQKFEVYDTYIDRGISGTSFERAGFDRLMDDVRNGKVNCIIVKDLSRFGRDYLETGNYIEKILPFLKVRFIAVTDGFDSMSDNVSEKKLAMNVKNLVNDMYAKDISKRVMGAKKLAAQQGAYIGSTAPYGYHAEKVNGVRKLVPHPENARIVRYLFESYAAGTPYKEMVSYLYREKVHRISDYNKYGHTFREDGEVLHQWNSGVIRGVLGNPVYAGRLVQGKRKSGLQAGQKGIRYTEQDEWVTVENSHEPIITPEFFDMVHSVLSGTGGQTENKSGAVKRAVRDDENIFRHILYCGGCGGKMHARYYQSRVNGKRKYSYDCRGIYYIDGRKCSGNGISEEQLEKYVLEQVRGMLESRKISSKDLTEMNRRKWEERKAVYLEEQDSMIRERQKLKIKAGNVYMQYKEGGISGQEYAAFRENRAEYEKYCEKRLEELKRKIRRSEIRPEEQDKFLCSLKKVQMIDALIERITVFPEGIIDILFRFEGGDGGGCDA